MLIVLTGNGKGKTSSAIGTAIRSAGWKNKTSIIFFDKGGDHYGEQFFLEKCPMTNSEPSMIDVFRFGNPRFNEESQTFRFENTEEDAAEATRAAAKLLTLYTKGYFLIVADELINCLNLGLLDEPTVRNLIEKCPKETHLLLTGRNAPSWLIEKADLVSEVTEVKHYYKKIGKPIKGIDY